MKSILRYLVITLGIALITSIDADDELSPAVPVVPNIAPAPTLAPPTTESTPIPGGLETLASNCHNDLNQSGTTDTDLQHLIVTNDITQATSLITTTNSCRLFAEKAVVTFVILNPKSNTIIRGGIQLNSPLTPAGPAFPTQICQAICAYSCRPSVGIVFSVNALSHGCTPCAKVHPCALGSVL